MEHTAWCVGALVALLTAAAVKAAEAREEDLFWRNVTVRLEGALPNTDPRLADVLEIYLGRGDDGKWRRYVLGHSALFDPKSTGDWVKDVRQRRQYTWFDHEGTLLEVAEAGDTIRLVVDVTITPDPWVGGGKVRADIRLKRDGHRLSGTYAGSFDKAAKDRAGETGRKATKGAAAGAIREKLWPSPVAGHVPLKRGEHPRLLFRRHDLPALKERLATPEGKALFEILKEQAGDGGRMGTWHGWALGLLHQLTGEAKWADLARRFAEGVIAGKVKSDRYGWFTRDGGYMRVGPSAAAVAAAYDMCCDAWQPDFRKWVAGKIQQRICPCMIDRPVRGETDFQFSQRSNHYGLREGGAGTCILAVKGDEGTDDEAVFRAHRILMQRLKRGLVDGFGDHGWFYEGTFCGRFPTLGGFLPYIHAMRVAEGKDYVTNCSEARWLTTKWIYEFVRTGGRVTYRSRGMYGKLDWTALSGDFAMGLGDAPPEHRPAILWFCRKVMEPGGIERYDVGTGDKAAVNAAFAFVNWPIGLEAKDPAAVLGHVLYDREANFFVFRSDWQGEGDIVLSMHGDATVLGMGLREQFPVAIPPAGEVTHFAAGDKTACVSAVLKGGTPGADGLYVVAADFSGLSGSPALFAGVFVPAGQAEAPPTVAGPRPPWMKGPRRAPAVPPGKPCARTTTVPLAAGSMSVMTVQNGTPPDVRPAGQGKDRKVVVGRRTIAFDGGKIVFAE